MWARAYGRACVHTRERLCECHSVLAMDVVNFRVLWKSYFIS